MGAQLILALDGSPTGGGRTRTAIEAVAAGAAGNGATVRTIAIGDEAGEGRAEALASLDAADAVILGSPVYRGTYAAPLKQLLDQVPRSGDEHRDSPLAGKALAIVYTGAGLQHFLALDGLRNVLAGFFAAHVVPPGLYVPREGFDEAGALAEPYAGQARDQGRALAELVGVLAKSTSLRSLRPQA